MAHIPKNIVSSVQKFVTLVQQQRRVEAIYLYGSYAKGTATQWSDIDLAVISPDFSDDLFQEQVNLMLLAAKVDDRIEPRPFTPATFKLTEPLVSEIRKTGISLNISE